MTDSTSTLDPALDPIEAARARAESFVTSIMNNTLVDLTARRDEIDNLMERIRVSSRALSAYIGEFARFNHEALVLSKQIKKSVAEATLPFAATPPATLTQSSAQSNGEPQS